MDYIDGMSLYGGYFIPNAVDSLGTRCWDIGGAGDTLNAFLKKLTADKVGNATVYAELTKEAKEFFNGIQNIEVCFDTEILPCQYNETVTTGGSVATGGHLEINKTTDCDCCKIKEGGKAHITGVSELGIKVEAVAGSGGFSFELEAEVKDAEYHHKCKPENKSGKKEDCSDDSVDVTLAITVKVEGEVSIGPEKGPKVGGSVKTKVTFDLGKNDLKCREGKKAGK